MMTRLKIAWHVLRGHSVGYRLTIRGQMAVSGPCAFAENMIDPGA